MYSLFRKNRTEISYWRALRKAQLHILLSHNELLHLSTFNSHNVNNLFT